MKYTWNRIGDTVICDNGECLPAYAGNPRYDKLVEEGVAIEPYIDQETLLSEADKAKRDLALSDSRMPRISEDAIRKLIEKGILSRDDFETAALEVLDSRDALRKKLK